MFPITDLPRRYAEHFYFFSVWSICTLLVSTTCLQAIGSTPEKPDVVIRETISLSELEKRFANTPRTKVSYIELNTLAPFRVDKNNLYDPETGKMPNFTIFPTNWQPGFLPANAREAWRQMQQADRYGVYFGKLDNTLTQPDSAFFDLTPLVRLFPNLKKIKLGKLDYRLLEKEVWQGYKGTFYIYFPPVEIVPLRGIFKVRGLKLYPVLLCTDQWRHDTSGTITFTNCALKYGLPFPQTMDGVSIKKKHNHKRAQKGGTKHTLFLQHNRP